MQQMCYSSGIMLVEASMEFPLTEQAIMRIAGRVAQTLRQDLEMIAAQVAAPGTRDDQPTVGEVARRLRVAPSTVCAHWREWGGFKLSDGARAPIRFDADRLPAGERAPGQPRQRKTHPPSKATHKRRRRATLIADAPRLIAPLGETG
jgi:hypothetical protein